MFTVFSNMMEQPALKISISPDHYFNGCTLFFSKDVPLLSYLNFNFLAVKKKSHTRVAKTVQKKEVFALYLG